MLDSFCNRSYADGASQMLATRGPGSFIGEVQVYEMGGEAQWQTCVLARDNVKVLVLYYKDVKDLITKRPEVEADVRASERSLTNLSYQI